MGMGDFMKYENSKSLDDKIYSIVERFANHSDMPEQPKNSYRCSMIPMCIRAHWLCLKEPAKFSSRTLKIFRAGKSVHESMELAFKNFGLFDRVDSEVALRKQFDGYSITGTADMIVDFNKKRRVVELKSTHSIWDKNEKKFQSMIYNTILTKSNKNRIMIFAPWGDQGLGIQARYYDTLLKKYNI